MYRSPKHTYPTVVLDLLVVAHFSPLSWRAPRRQLESTNKRVFARLTMSGLKVLVAGASIAGTSTAYWLAKAGARVTVVERFPQLRTGGQAVDIRTAGVTVMRKMVGMEALVRAKSTQEEGISFVREDGTPYGVIRPTGNPDQQSIISEYEIFRGDLAKILYDFTKNDRRIEYVFGEQIASMQQSEADGASIKVDFTHNLPTTAFDLVVACDGATSRTRALGLGCGVRDHIIPTGLWIAYWSLEQDLLDGSRIGQGFNAVGGRSISLGRDPAGGSRVMVMNTQPQGKDDVQLTSLREAANQGDDALKDFVAQHYRDVGWKTQACLQGMRDAEDFYASEMVQVKLPALSEGRFVLVGDAGYACGPTGGGTSLALTGAYILAGELSKHPDDVAAGLQAYEDQMRPLISELQKIPPFLSTFMMPQTSWGIWFRNKAFAIIAWSGIADFAQRYLAAGFASTDSFPLPDYKWTA